MEKLSCSSPHSRHGGTTKPQKKCKIHQDATKSGSCDFLWKFTTLICSAAMQWSCGIFARAATFFGGDFLFSIKPTSCEYTSFLDAGPLVNLFSGRWKIKAASHRYIRYNRWFWHQGCVDGQEITVCLYILREKILRIATAKSCGWQTSPSILNCIGYSWSRLQKVF